MNEIELPTGLDRDVIESVLIDVLKRFSFNWSATITEADRVLRAKGFEFSRWEIAGVYDRM